MYEEKELFKHSFRDFQKPVFQEMLNGGNQILLKTPMDFGKTYLACAYVSHLFETKQIRSATFSIPNYQMRRKVIDDLKAVGMKDAVIVCPEGRERAFKSQRKRVSSLRIGKDDLKGQAIDLDYVQRRWPKHNSYNILIYLQRYADVIIVHHSMLKVNRKLRKTDLLVVDDADLMNRDSVFHIAQFKVFQKHLQATDNTLTDFNFKEIRKRIADKKEGLMFFNAALDELGKVIPENPKDLESEFVLEIQTQEESPLSKTVNEILSQKLTDDEKLRNLLDRRYQNVQIGISQAANPVKWNSLLNGAFRERIKFFADELKDEVDQEISYAVSSHIDFRIEDFFNALLDPEFQVKLGQIDNNWSLLDVYLRNGSNFMDVVNRYTKILWISATADPEAPQFKSFRVVKSDVDPNSQFKHVKEISEGEIKDVIDNLQNRNVFVVTNSGNGAQKFVQRYGCGEILNRDSMDGIVRNAQNGKGIIAVSYVNGIGSRGLDNMAELFDAVILESWIYRSVIQEDGKFYGEDHLQNNLSDAVQIIARIMRGSKDHILFVVKDENETGAKIQDFLKEQNPSWNYADGDYTDPISRIPERTDNEPTQKEKQKLRKETRTLRDGTKELIYRKKATDKEISDAPDYIEI